MLRCCRQARTLLGRPQCLLGSASVVPPPLPPTHARASLLHASSTRFFSSRKPQRRQLIASNGHRGAMGKKHRGGSQQPQQAKQGKKKHQGKASTTTCSYVQVLSPGQDVYGGEAPASVLLFFDKRRYLFNCAEGFQRLCVEHKIRMTRIDHLFFTRSTTDASGGLPGYLLTRGDSGAIPNEMGLYGPPPLYSMLSAIRNYCYINYKLKPTQWSPSHSTPFGDSDAILGEARKSTKYVDEYVTITAMVIQAAQQKPSSESTQVNTAEISEAPQSAEGNDTKGIAPESAPKRRKLLPSTGLPIIESSKQSKKRRFAPIVCYSMKLPEVPGKFNVQKAEALKVPHDRRRAQLIRGEAITTDDGRTIRPEDVVADSIPGPVVLVIDCPSEEYLDGLTANDELKSYMSPKTDASQTGANEKVSCVIHLAPARILRHPIYIEWKKDFPAATTHIAPAGFSSSVAPAFLSASRVNARLNCINEMVFPLQGTVEPEDLPSTYLRGENTLKFQLRPIASLGVDSSTVPVKVDVNTVQQEVLDSFKQQELENEVSLPTKLQNVTMASNDLPECLQNVGREEMELVFLGTGAAQPSKYRNVTSLYTHFFDKGGFLLDVGEDTCGQLFRRFGQESKEILQNLQLIWISHIHADHHAGLFPLLRRRRAWLLENSGSCPTLKVVGPRPLARVLQAYEKFEPLAVEFIDCSEFRNDNEPSSGASKLDPVLERLGLHTLQCVPVLHCPHAYGIVFEHKKGWKVAVSGDTRPCQKLIEAAKDATILVHEATFEDSLLDEAIAKRHSITKEAVESGAACGAYRVLLTHFSQRYPKIPVFDDSYTDRTAIAFDLMSVNIADVHFLPKLLPSLKFLFRDEMIEEDENAAGELEEVEA